jgi:LysM repeat protein
MFKKITLISLTYLYLVTNIAQAVIWEGESAGLNIRWTKSEITATTPFGRQIFSTTQLAQKNFEADFLMDKSLYKNNPCKYKRNFVLLSVVGSIVTISDTEYTSCKTMAHPSIDHNFRAIDLAKSAQAVKLTDLFLESDILAALLNDKIIKLSLKGKTPTTLTELFNVLEWSEIVIKDCTYRLPIDFLSQFAFHHVTARQVAMRLHLQPMTNVCESKNAQLGFYLSIPRTLKMALNRAQMQNSGFLMQDQLKKTSTISFSTTNYKPRSAPTPKIKQQYEYHTVVAGDTLYSISKQYHTKVKILISLNNLSTYILEIGQRLKISKKTPKTTILKQIKLIESIERSKLPVEIEAAAELELSHLTSLQKICNTINIQNQQTRFRTWLNKQADKQLLEYSNGKWLVNSEAFWRLHDKYYPLPISDKIDWQAAENLNIGNCDFECSLDWLNQTTVTYLKYHPTGKYVDQALNKILAFTDKYKTETSLLNTKNLPRLFAVIHITVGRTNHHNTDRVLGDLDRLRELVN